MPAFLLPADAIDKQLVRRVLVTKLRHHGDVLLVTPVLTALQQHFPAAQIDALVYQETQAMLQYHPALHTLHTIDKQWKRLGLFAQAQKERGLLKRLRARHYDLVVHLTEHQRGAWLCRMLAPRYAVAPELKFGTSLTQRLRKRLWQGAFTHRYQNESSPKGQALIKRHTVEQNLDALRRLGLQIDLHRPLFLAPGAAAENAIAERMQQAALVAKQFIVVHPGSRWLFKCWAPEQTAELIHRLCRMGWQVVITAAPDARELALRDAILQALQNFPEAQHYQPQIHDFSATLTLLELAALLAQARMLIGVDSAPMHMAAALQTPVVALFGPSGEEAWRPWQVPHRVITSQQHACRPCGLDGCGSGKRSECLTTLPVTQVLAAVQSLLNAEAAA